MTEEQQKHAGKIAAQAYNLINKKYEKGAIEHKSNIWERDDLLDMAIEEAVDMVVYLLTLKEQKDVQRQI